MAKSKRPSMSDALADIAASGPPVEEVVTLPRDNVVTGHVTRDNVRQLPIAVDMPRNSTTADGYRLRLRREKPHASLYASPKVFEVVRDIAKARNKKPHDLYTEGLRLVLANYGYDFDALSRE